jgi:hypothetical protein
VFNRSGGAPGGWDTFERKRFDYLAWLANAEGQLGNFTDEAHVAHQLHTAGLAAIRNADGATPWPAQLLESEIRAQKDALTRAAAALRQQVERVEAAAGHIAVLDTHVLLHYEPPESVDWPAIVGVSPVRLLLPMQVVDELDEKKYTGSDKVRGRGNHMVASFASEAIDRWQVASDAEQPLLMIEALYESEVRCGADEQDPTLCLYGSRTP